MADQKGMCDGRDLRQETTHPLMVKLYGLVDQMNHVVQTYEDDFPDSIQNTTEADLSSVIDSCEKMLANSKKAAGEFLHCLYVEPDETVVQKVIAACPEALLDQDDRGNIPIQNAINFDNSIKYIPLLAREASRHEIVPERGGLLLPFGDNSNNILQDLVGYRSATATPVEELGYDENHLQALKDLRRNGLLLDEDFVSFNLIGLASRKGCYKRLEYLLELCPKSLSLPQPNGDYIIHPSNYGDPEDMDVFAKLLNTGMQHYPEKFGFLFKRNGNGDRAIAQAISNYGKEETLHTVQKMIPPTKDHPILHHVSRFTPELLDDFIYRYPDAIYLKDRQGRYLLHVAVKRGLKLSGFLFMMIHSNKACIEEKDPVTNLYPFMLAATSGYRKDLTTIYKLLTLRPEIISKCLENGVDW